MDKAYKGYELIKAIQEGKIKPNTEIEVHELTVTDRIVTTVKCVERGLRWKEGPFNTGYLYDKNYYFRVEETIDIDSIEEIENEVIQYDWRKYAIEHHNKLNELIKAVKQLHKETNELKER